MNPRVGTGRCLVAVAFLVAAPVVHSSEPAVQAAATDPLYEEVLGGMYSEVMPSNTGSALTVDMGQGVHLNVPARFAEQKILTVERLAYLGPGLEDAVAVGLHAYDANGIGQAFALVYALNDKQATLKAELPLRQYFIGFETVTINQQSVLAIHGASGAHFHDLWLYRFTTGKPELLLAQGSAAGVELRPDLATGDPQIWVGVENWDDPDWNYASGERLWNVYTWDGQQFAMNSQLSTAPIKTAGERAEGYVAAVKSHMTGSGQ